MANLSVKEFPDGLMLALKIDSLKASEKLGAHVVRILREHILRSGVVVEERVTAKKTPKRKVKLTEAEEVVPKLNDDELPDEAFEFGEGLEEEVSGSATQVAPPINKPVAMPFRTPRCPYCEHELTNLLNKFRCDNSACGSHGRTWLPNELAEPRSAASSPGKCPHGFSSVEKCIKMSGGCQ